METKLAQHVGAVGAEEFDNPDRLEKSFAIKEVTSETYPKKEQKGLERPRDTQKAVEDLLCCRLMLVSYRSLALGKSRSNMDSFNALCLQQSLHNIFHMSHLATKYRRARKRMDFARREMPGTRISVSPSVEIASNPFWKKNWSQEATL